MDEKFTMDMTNAGVNTFAVGSAIFDERPIKKDKIWNLPNRTKEAFFRWERK